MSRFDWTTPAGVRAYYRDYERRRRTRCRRSGRCVQCGKARAKRGLTPHGTPYTRCQRCLVRQARCSTAYRLTRIRLGFCASCPRRRPRGDRHWNCPRCRAKQNRRNKLVYWKNYQARRRRLRQQRLRRAA